MNKETIPVFVFLDENIAKSDTKIAGCLVEDFPEELEKFDLFILPFPNQAKSKADHEVIIFIKNLIFSDKRIEEYLRRGPSPIFIFLTLDLNFVEDVKLGLELLSGKKLKSAEGVEVGENSFFLNKSGVKVELFSVSVFHRANLRKKALIKEIALHLKNFIAQNF